MSPLAGDNSPVSSFAPVYDENRVTIWQGDVRTVLAALPAESVQCVVTSPPYWGLRDYGTGTWIDGDAACDHVRMKRGENSTIDGGGYQAREIYSDICGKCGARRQDAQIGLEATPEEYIAAMVAVFREVRRVLRHDGTLWLNMGDSYVTGAYSARVYENLGTTAVRDEKYGEEARMPTNWRNDANKIRRNGSPSGMKTKDLMGMPWMLAFALRADGWYLRSDIIWAKPNPMPESVNDRPTKAHEYIFLLTKSERYFYDADAIREAAEYGRREWSDVGAVLRSVRNTTPAGTVSTTQKGTVGGDGDNPAAGRNKRSVWEVATQAFPEAHFATFPEALIQPCILAGTSEKGCCAHCGAPWQRIVEPSEEYAKNLGKGYHDHAGDGVEYGLRQKGGGPKSIAADYRTIGWEPTCACKSDILSGGLQVEPAPCTVLDPFFGSGTTALVARKNGCRAIGVELNPAYIEIAKRRLRQSVLPF